MYNVDINTTESIQFQFMNLCKNMFYFITETIDWLEKKSVEVL